VDDVLACLMSMGFSLEDGQEAVQNGYLSVERAVEWYVIKWLSVNTENRGMLCNKMVFCQLRKLWNGMQGLKFFRNTY
jgi:hypothetical protein